jgi:hypothetical protein
MAEEGGVDDTYLKDTGISNAIHMLTGENVDGLLVRQCFHALHISIKSNRKILLRGTPSSGKTMFLVYELARTLYERSIQAADESDASAVVWAHGPSGTALIFPRGDSPFSPEKLEDLYALSYAMPYKDNENSVFIFDTWAPKQGLCRTLMASSVGNRSVYKDFMGQEIPSARFDH